MRGRVSPLAVEVPIPTDIEYRERLFRVTDSFQVIPDGIGTVIVITAQLLGDRPAYGTDWVHAAADSDEIKACFARLADRMLAEVETRN